MRLALYAHYSSSDGLALYVLHFLRELRELGFQICFISNSPIPPPREPELRELCDKIIQRENTGYDFAMWKRALAEYELAQFDELLLTNSSIVGPFHPLKPLWERAAAFPCDFWGLTDNDEFTRHLQSYFLVFRRKVLEDPCFQAFWRSVLPFHDKEAAVASYEIGLSKWLEQHGFKWKALFPQKDVQALYVSRRSFFERVRNRIRCVGLLENTTIFLPDLLVEIGMPFLKLKLLAGGGEGEPARVNRALRNLQTSNFPEKLLDELRKTAAE